MCVSLGVLWGVARSIHLSALAILAPVPLEREVVEGVGKEGDGVEVVLL